MLRWALVAALGLGLTAPASAQKWDTGAKWAKESPRSIRNHHVRDKQPAPAKRGRMKTAFPATTASSINPNIPIQGANLLSQPIRANFAAAAFDINNIYAQFAAPTNFLTAGTGIAITTSGTVSLAPTAGSTLLANITGGTVAPVPITFSTLVDAVCGNSQGSVIYRGASTWSCLGAGTAGSMLQTNGAGAIPSWSAAALGGTQAANLVYASPNASSGVPLFRSLVAADMPLGILNANLALMPATTLKGNASGSSATPSDLTSAQVQQILPVQSPPQGRLTLATGTPVMSTSVTGSTTIFYTPYLGQYVPIYNGTALVMTDTGGELSQASTDTTKSPAAVAVTSCYDVFVWNDAGTVRATRGPAWTNLTTRSAGTALAKIKGLLVNAVAITNGPGINLGTYVGTACSNATSTFDWIYGGAGTGGVASSFSVWNTFNRVAVFGASIDNGAAYAYAVSAVRPPRGAITMRVNWVVGLVEDAWIAYSATTYTPAAGSLQWGLSFNSTSTFYQIGAVNATGSISVGTTTQMANTAADGMPTLGQNFVSPAEWCAASSSGTFDALSPTFFSYLHVATRM